MFLRNYFLFIVFLVFFGCGEKAKDESKVEYSAAPIDQAGLRQLIENRNGKVLLLNIWATWCVPCREEFPDLVRLASYYKNKDVEIVGISADYPDEVETKIIPFLQTQRVNFNIYVQNFSDESGFINQLNSGWNGALPASFIYDASGKQKSFLIGKRSFDEFKWEIETVRH